VHKKPLASITWQRSPRASLKKCYGRRLCGLSEKRRLLEKYRDSLREEKQPKWVEPMLAILTHDYFDDPNWIYERKLDGERCLAFKTEDKVDLLSRNRQPLNRAYPEIAQALSRQDGSFILDGEIVAFEGDVTSFSKLQQRMFKEGDIEKTGIAVYYYVFDIIHLDGYDTTGLELRHRKQLLKASIDFSDPLRYTMHVNEKGIEYHEEACRKGWEGIMAKDGSSKYLHIRSKEWLKFKCRNQAEFVVGGYTDPKGERKDFGALLLGYYDDRKLMYAGKVGTGYTDETLERLGKKLKDIEVEKSPYYEDVDEKDAHWVKPELVCEVKFTEWTEYNKLRHPVFLGLRRDKDPEDVDKEEAK
jgi:bifunctional non-homologous end joining protein LigD